MSHNIKRLTRADYLGCGGQGLVMTRTQFLNLFKTQSPAGRPYLYTPLQGGGQNIQFTSSSDMNAMQIVPDDSVVKLFPNQKTWLSEVKELLGACIDIDLPYINPSNMGGVFTSMSQEILVYGGGFVSSTLNLHSFCVIFMKEMKEITVRELVKLNVAEKNQRIWNTVVLPLILQLHKYHTKGKVHRDIKHLNVMMHNGCATLIDFGLAMAPDTTLLTNPHPLGTYRFISSWYYMVLAMYSPSAPQRVRVDKENWFFEKLINFKYYETNDGDIGDTIDFINSLSEMQMIRYLNATYPIKKTTDSTSDVMFCMKMNDWYALGVTIQVLYNMQLPPLPNGMDSTGFFSCFKPSPHKQLLSDIKNLCSTKVPNIVDQEMIIKIKWPDLLKAISAHNTLKSTYQRGGGVKKVSKSAQPLRKVLGKSRKVYKITGMGNALYVKVMGREMTLKDARALDAKQSKQSKQSKKSKQ